MRAIKASRLKIIEEAPIRTRRCGLWYLLSSLPRGRCPGRRGMRLPSRPLMWSKGEKPAKTSYQSFKRKWDRIRQILLIIHSNHSSGWLEIQVTILYLWWWIVGEWAQKFKARVLSRPLANNKPLQELKYSMLREFVVNNLHMVNQWQKPLQD
jgi:hypothetical protein